MHWKMSPQVFLVATYLVLLSVLSVLLVSCGGGGGGDGDGSGTPVESQPTGPGDTELYFPNTIGDTWYYNLTDTDSYGTIVNNLTKLAVTGTKTVLGQLSSIFEEQTYSAPLSSVPTEDYYAKDLGGVSYLGNNDPSETLSPQLVPYRELVFPVQIGQITQLSKSGLDFGSDLDGDNINETFDLTLQSDITAFEPVSVAAGSFPNAAKRLSKLDITLQLSSLGISIPTSATEEAWAVAGAGVVKQSITTTSQNPTDGSTSNTSTIAEARGYIVGGARYGMGWPLTIADNMSPGDGYVPVPLGHPVVASDGTNFLVMARKATGTPPNWLAQWVGTLVGPDGGVLQVLDATVPTPVYNRNIGEKAAITFDGTNYLFVYEKDNNFASTGLGPSLNAMFISPEGVLGSSTSVAPEGSDSPALGFDGTNYFLAYRNTNSSPGLEQIYGVFISPATGQVTEAGEFSITLSPGYQTEPVVAFDGTNYLVVWDQALWDAQNPGIYAARVERDGTIIDQGGFQVSTQMGNPAIAFDGTNYLVAYQRSFGNQNYRILATGISREGQLLDGSPATGGFSVTTGTTGSSVSPTLTFTGGEYWAAWVSSPAIGVYDGIFGARIGTDGLIISPGNSGMRMSPKARSSFPAIVANPSGGLLVWLNQLGANSPNELAVLPIYPFGP
jgi:hypothetical protein